MYGTNILISNVIIINGMVLLEISMMNVFAGRIVLVSIIWNFFTCKLLVERSITSGLAELGVWGYDITNFG